MTSFQRERLFDVADDVEGLLQLHYDEVALHRDAVPLDPNWARYAMTEEAGQLAIFTARDAGRVVGYSVFFVSPHMHYDSTLTAVNDVLFLHPAYRKGACGIRLIKFSEQELKAQGVKRVLWHIKFNKDFSAILHRLGYADEEKIVGKML
jgi:GNAT superfamily N-acetyltransferase